MSSEKTRRKCCDVSNACSANRPKEMENCLELKCDLKGCWSGQCHGRT